MTEAEQWTVGPGAVRARAASTVPLSGALVAAFVALAALWSVVTPIYEAPDEKGHIEYAAHLATQRTLPVQTTTPRTYAHHPPLYYALAAVAGAVADWQDERDMPEWVGPGPGAGNRMARARHHTAETFPWRGRVAAIHAARFVSVLMGAAAVAFTIAAGRLAFPTQPTIGLLAGALLACTPQFSFISGAVSNDSTAAAAGAAVLWALLRARQQPAQLRRWLLLGVLCGTALLAKATTLSLVVLAGGAWFFLRTRFPSPRRWAAAGAMLAAVVLLTAGWWFAHNATLYGDFLGWTAYRAAWPHMIRSELPDLAELGALASLQWRSYWGDFGWLTLPSGNWLTLGAGGLLAAAAWGWRRRCIERKNRGGISAPILMCALAVGMHAVYLFGQNLFQTAVMAQGRHLFPAAGAAMILVAGGLLAGAHGRAERRARAFGIAATAAAANLACALLIVAPAYRGPALPKMALLSVPHRIDAGVADMLQLRGFALRSRSNGTTAVIRVRMYWQAQRDIPFDYAVFVDALDANDMLLARNFIVPGQRENFAPAAWKSGDVVADEWVLNLPATSANKVQRLRIGAYDWRDGSLLGPIRGSGAAGQPTARPFTSWRVAGPQLNYIVIDR